MTKVKDEQDCEKEICCHVGCINEVEGILEIGSISLGSCKLHLDMVNGYVDLDGKEVVGLVKRPAIKLFENDAFECLPVNTNA